MQRVIQPGSGQGGQVAARRRRPRYERRLWEQVLCGVTSTLANFASAIGESQLPGLLSIHMLLPTALLNAGIAPLGLGWVLKALLGCILFRKHM